MLFSKYFGQRAYVNNLNTLKLIYICYVASIWSFYFISILYVLEQNVPSLFMSVFKSKRNSNYKKTRADHLQRAENELYIRF